MHFFRQQITRYILPEPFKYYAQILSPPDMELRGGGEGDSLTRLVYEAWQGRSKGNRTKTDDGQTSPH